MTAQEIFETHARHYITRKGIDALLGHLPKTDFYIAPASTRFHDSFEGGLVTHSIKVFEELLKENDKFDYKLDTESLAICGLFHDICKTGFYKVEMRNTKNEQGKWIQVPYYTVDDKLPYGHGEKSVYMIQSLMQLKVDEAIAIRWHMGGFEPKEHHQIIGQAYEEYPLAVLLSIADMKATFIK